MVNPFSVSPQDDRAALFRDGLLSPHGEAPGKGGVKKPPKKDPLLGTPRSRRTHYSGTKNINKNNKNGDDMETAIGHGLEQTDNEMKECIITRLKERQTEEEYEGVMSPFQPRTIFRRTPVKRSQSLTWRGKNKEEETNNENKTDTDTEEKSEERKRDMEEAIKDLIETKRRRVSTPTKEREQKKLKKSQSSPDVFAHKTKENNIQQTISKMFEKIDLLQETTYNHTISKKEKQLINELSNLADVLRTLEPNYKRKEVELPNLNNREELVQTVGKKWPQELFKKVGINNGEPETNIKYKNTVLLIEDKDTEESKKNLINKFTTFEEEVIEIDEFTFCDNTRQVITKGNNKETQQWRNWLITKKGHDIENIIDSCLELAKTTENITHINCIIPRERTDAARKCLEWAMQDTDTTITIYKYGEQNTKNRKQRTEKVDTLIITQKDRTYADLLKEVKQVVGSDKEGIKSVRKSRDGKMILTIKKQEGVTEKIKNKIGVNVKGVNIKTKDQRLAKLKIQRLDETVDEEELRGAITEEAEKNGSSPTFGKIILKPAYGGRQTATVEIDRATAELLKLSKLYVGLAPVVIKEYIYLNRCYRCWHYGHNAKECRGTDLTGACHNCGEGDHKAQDCQNDSYCPVCEAPKHKAGSAQCAAFRKAYKDKQSETKEDTNKAKLSRKERKDENLETRNGETQD